MIFSCLQKPVVFSVLVAALVNTPAFTQEMTDWYPFKPTNTPAPGAIGMADWLEKPAGKHGRIERSQDELVYNGQPIKLWGMNFCFAACAGKAARRAASGVLY